MIFKSLKKTISGVIQKEMPTVFLGFFVFIVQIVQILWLSNMQQPSDAIRLQLAFSKNSFLSITEAWNQMDQSIFLMHYMFDFFYPAFYGIFLFLILKKMNFKSARYLPFAAATFDLIENTFHFMLVSGYLPVLDPLVFTGGTASLFKWILVAISLILIAANLRQRFKKTA